MVFGWIGLIAAMAPPSAWQVEPVATGFKFVEGPVWSRDGRLLFSDIPADTLYAVVPGKPAEVWRKPSQQANGNTFDRQGRLISCEHASRRVTRTAQDGKVTAIAEHFDGKRLNSPNDVTVAKSGEVYFTDPPYGVKEQDRELTFSGVFRIGSDGKVTLLHDALPRPNGLVFSPDERTLYVADSQEGFIYSFPVRPDGTLGERHTLVDLRGDKPGVPDGIRVDQEGNIYTGGSGGLYQVSPSGQKLRFIPFKESVTNVAFGGDGKWLYVTAGTGVYRLRTEVAGIAPAGTLPNTATR